MKIVVELIFVAILVACVWAGYKKGLVMTFGSILMIIISLFVGDLLSDTFSHEAVPVIHPFVAGYMEGSEGVMNEALVEVIGTSGTGTLSFDDAIAQHPEASEEFCKLSFMKLGVYESSAQAMAQETIAISEQTSSSLSASVVNVMCDKITYYLGFILFFAVTIILLTVLGNITNLSFKLPHMDKLNTIGGAVGGFVTGLMFCFLVAWILKFTGAFLPQEDLGILARMFVGMNTYSHFLSI